MIHSKTYTEEELYVDDIDQPEDDMKGNIREREFPRLEISWDIYQCYKNEITRILKELSMLQKLNHPDTQGTK